MIVEHKYRLNRNGNIHKDEKVEIICDCCGNKWRASYKSRKMKSLNQDLCSSCRGKYTLNKRKAKPWEIKRKDVRIHLKCSYCEAEMLRIPSQVNTKNNFCSIACRDEFNFKEKYRKIEDSFSNNPDEVAYLIGLILGDGHIRKSGKHTVRVGIAFDYSGKWDWMLPLTKDVLSKLDINWFEEKKSHNGCKMIWFALPSSIMKKYGVLFTGDKYKTQPYPSGIICGNINYVVALLNSDGCARKNQFIFVNTVESIVQSFIKCLDKNKIRYTVKKKEGRLDKRTGNIGRQRYIVYINNRKETKTLIELANFKLKGINKCHSL